MIRKLYIHIVYLIALAFASAAQADNFGVTNIKHLTEEDIASIPINTSYEQLEKMFGQYTRLDGYAIGWPKQTHKNLENIDKWRRAYWFFYKSNDKGRPIYPLILDYIASFPESFEYADQSLMSLLPNMVIDWPEQLKGKNFMDLMKSRSKPENKH